MIANYWVGSTTAQSPLGRTWPGSMPFPWSLSALWPLVLPGCVIPIWKEFDKANNVRDPLWVTWAVPQGVNFLRIWHFIIKLSPLKSNFKRHFCFYLRQYKLNRGGSLGEK